jgi:hypothetical protein
MPQWIAVAAKLLRDDGERTFLETAPAVKIHQKLSSCVSRRAHRRVNRRGVPRRRDYRAQLNVPLHALNVNSNAA